MLAHISAVFGLVEKAMRCTSDSEMILTALQSIRQLRMIKEREWDARALVKMVASVPSFKKEDVAVDLWGELISDTSVEQETERLTKHFIPYHSVYSFVCMRMRRSGECVCLQRIVLRVCSL